MLRRFLLLATAIVAMPGAALAQVDADDATASVQILAVVNVTATEHIDFGVRPRTDGIVLSSAVPTRAGWSVTMDTSDDVQIDFVLPTHLTATGGSVLALLFGPTSAHLMDGAADVTFDPASGLQINDVAPTFDVYLGEDENRNGSGDVVVDVTDGIGGLTYSAVITMTVTIL